MREKVRDKERLKHILEAINNIEEFCIGKEFSDFVAEKILWFAIIKNLEIIGEASYLITRDFRSKNPHIEWNAIIGMRHILVHGYYQIRNEIIWATIEQDIPNLKSAIQKLISDFPETDSESE